MWYEICKFSCKAFPELMTPSETSEKITTETPLQTSGIDFLMSDFESLLSGNDLETLYQ